MTNLNEKRDTISLRPSFGTRKMWRRTTIRRDPLNSRESPSETELKLRS